MRKIFFLLLFLPVLSWAQILFQEGEAFFQQEKFSKAKSGFEAYLKTNPGHKKTREYLGDIAGYEKDWDTAMEYYKGLVSEEPGNANYHFKYGGVMGMKALEISRIRALAYIGDIRFHLEKATKLDPAHIEARWALVEFYIQLPGIIGGSERKASEYADELGKISPVDGHLAHGYIAEYNNRPEDAEKHYKQAIAVGGSPHTYDKLIGLYEKNKQPRQAINTASRSLKVHKRNTLNYQIGKIAAQYNLDAELGIHSLQAYIRDHSVRDGVPKDWAYYRLAQIYRNLGEKEKALQWINKALTARPDFEEAREEEARILSL